MSKNPSTEKIISYLREKQNDIILNYEITQVSTLKKIIKNDAIEHLQITEDIWKANSEHISSYIKAVLTIKYLKINKKTIYEALFNCKNKDEVINLIKDELPETYSSAHNICKHIISEIKFIKNINNIPNQPTTNKDKTFTVKELNRHISSDKEFMSNLLDSTDDEIKKAISEKFKNVHDIPPELIDEWIEKYKKFNSIELSETKPINQLTFLKEDAAKEIANLYSKNTELVTKLVQIEEENNTLKMQLDDTNKQLDNYKFKEPIKTTDHIFSVEIKELNKLLNSNSSESHISVKDEILNRISKYIDKYSLIRIEDIINQNRDLKSEMVQIILLSFLHEKSLL